MQIERAVHGSTSMHETACSAALGLSDCHPRPWS
jgi:hypothetical protein